MTPLPQENCARKLDARPRRAAAHPQGGGCVAGRSEGRDQRPGAPDVPVVDRASRARPLCQLRRVRVAVRAAARLLHPSPDAGLGRDHVDDGGGDRRPRGPRPRRPVAPDRDGRRDRGHGPGLRPGAPLPPAGPPVHDLRLRGDQLDAARPCRHFARSGDESGQCDLRCVGRRLGSVVETGWHPPRVGRDGAAAPRLRP